jgi:hypothetical protein
MRIPTHHETWFRDQSRWRPPNDSPRVAKKTRHPYVVLASALKRRCTLSRAAQGSGHIPTFFNRAGLRNALSILGFTGAEASAEFGAMQYDAGLHFPWFADAFPDQRRMRCARFASVNRLDANFSSKHSYFDGVHRMHSEGRDRV